MKIPSVPSCLILFVCGFFTACTTSTTSTKTRPGYRIANTAINAKGYHEPKVAALSENGAMVGMLAGGFVGAIVGSTVDHSIQHTKQKDFEKRHEGLLIFEEQIDIEALTALLDQKMQFHRERFEAREESLGNLWLEIHKYGLFVVQNEAGEETRLEGVMGIRIRSKLKDGSNGKYGPYFGYSDSSYQINDYIADPNLTNKVLREALLEAFKLVDERLAEFR